MISPKHSIADFQHSPVASSESLAAHKASNPLTVAVTFSLKSLPLETRDFQGTVSDGGMCMIGWRVGCRCKRFGRRTPQRRGRTLLFRLKAKALGLKALEFQFPYQCARVSLSEEVHESLFSLFCVGIRESIPASLSKTKLLEKLSFYLFGLLWRAISDERPSISRTSRIVGECWNTMKNATRSISVLEKRM